MTRTGLSGRVMVGVPLAGTLARHCTVYIFRQQGSLWLPAVPLKHTEPIVRYRVGAGAADDGWRGRLRRPCRHQA
jgi:hypothetical protein